MDTPDKLAPVELKNKHCSMHEKKNYYNAWKTSGLSQNKFCQKNHLALATFSNWVRNIEKKSLSKSKMSFIPVEVSSEVEKNEGIEIQFPNGVKCRLGKIEEVKKISALIKELHHAFIINSK